MKTSLTNDSDARLRTLLQEWKADAALPPRFQERVWKRIETTEPRSAKVDGGGWLAALFARPAFATVCATVLLLAGLATGFLRAEHDATRMNTELAQRYIATINPYAQPHH